MNKKNVNKNKTVEILLIEDNNADVRLIKETMRTSKMNNKITVLKDGEKAINFLKKIAIKKKLKPDIIVLDLNLPKIDGFEVLREYKKNKLIKETPLIIFSSSSEPKDIKKAYNLFANTYVVKPMDLDEYEEIVKKVEDFWFNTAKLPEKDIN